MAVLMIAIMVIVCVALPLFYCWRIWQMNAPSRVVWLLTIAEALIICLLVLLLGRWDMAGIHTRWLLAVIFLAAVLLSWRRHRARPWRGGAAMWRGRRATLLSLLLLGALLAWAVHGSLARHGPAMLGFPLAESTFVVGQGGGNSLLNYHHSHRAQRFAFDITAVNAAGVRATGLLPGDLSRYVIFGKPIISPCDGEVIAAEGNLPDQTPPEADPDHAAGNHAIIRCNGLEVTLAHLRQGSLRVRAGDHIATGDAIGHVGNSGNTSEPHLHIHATDANGNPAQIGFAGRLPVRNSVFRR